MIDCKKFLNIQDAFTFNSGQFFIRTVTRADIQMLREWKNKNKDFFHFKQDITPSQQEIWFEEFRKDPLQEIIVLVRLSGLIACVGFRKKTPEAPEAELFNLILGDKHFQGTGLMGVFFEKCRQALRLVGVRNINLEVLKTNLVAIKWYKQQGFVEQKCGDHASIVSTVSAMRLNFD